MSCTCQKCINCCWHNPGWFASIEEIESAAKMVNLPVHEFCREYLIREWWAGEEGIYIPAPRRNFDRKERRVKSEYEVSGVRVTKLLKEMWAEEERGETEKVLL